VPRDKYKDKEFGKGYPLVDAGKEYRVWVNAGKRVRA
jgi:hypothetical protein